MLDQWSCWFILKSFWEYSFDCTVFITKCKLLNIPHCGRKIFVRRGAIEKPRRSNSTKSLSPLSSGRYAPTTPRLKANIYFFEHHPFLGKMPSLRKFLVNLDFSYQITLRSGVDLAVMPCLLASTRVVKNYDGWWELGYFCKTSAGTNIYGVAPSADAYVLSVERKTFKNVTISHDDR